MCQIDDFNLTCYSICMFKLEHEDFSSVKCMQQQLSSPFLSRSRNIPSVTLMTWTKFHIVYSAQYWGNGNSSQRSDALAGHSFMQVMLGREQKRLEEEAQSRKENVERLVGVFEGLVFSRVTYFFDIVVEPGGLLIFP